MRNLLSTLSLCLLFLTGCAQFEEPEIDSAEGSEDRQSSTRSASANPYSLVNVQQAYNDLRPSLGLQPKTLVATHHYVRFNIQDSLMYKTVHDDLGLELIEYPLD